MRYLSLAEALVIAEPVTARPSQLWLRQSRPSRHPLLLLYIWHDDFGPCFIKICSYFRYPAKLWANGHGWAKRQTTKEGLAYTELANGFASCEAPGKLQAICDRLGSAHFQLLFEL